MSKKVRCYLCLNEKNGFCNVKKVKVKTNKPRLCEGYIFEESKVKMKDPVVTIRAHYNDQKKTQKDKILRGLSQTGNPKHPLTGDLSRFTTTAKKEE